MSIEYAPDAQADIQDATDSIFASLGLPVAAAFQNRLRSTLTGLEAMPHGGSPVDPPFPNYPELRFRPVKRFEARVVFYFPTPTGIRVIRVLHASQDMNAIFG